MEIRGKRPAIPSLAAAFLLGAFSAPTYAQLTYSGCPNVTKADFKKVPLVTRGTHAIAEPIQMAVAQDGRIFWVERLGKVRMWNPANPGTAVTLATLTAFTGQENGVSGIALDPGFQTNNWLYVFWAASPLINGSRIYRVSRFTVANDAIDMASQKPILDIPFTNFGCCHTGGSLVFDFAGNLFISVGNNTDNAIGEATTPKTNYTNQSNPHGDDQRGSANTNSLLGKILRIKPKALPEGGTASAPGMGVTYDIPAGNLFPLVDGQPQAKTRPEIYTMGHRNPYTISLDPYRYWLTWGDIGPDEGLESEEHNLVTKPGYMGWPYFAGANLKYRGTVGIDAADMDPNKPLNKSVNNTGLEELPPAQPAIRPYRQAAAITGPVYYYDGRLASAARLPPHFNKKWLFTDFNGGFLRVGTPSEDGKTLTADVELLPPGFLADPLDMEIGPDGALYVVEYAGWFGATAETAISRVEYTGTCADAALFPAPISALRDAGRMNGLGSGALLNVDARAGTAVLPEGVRGLALYDLKGSKVFGYRRTGSSTAGTVNVTLPAALRGSVLKARFTAD